MNSQSPEPHTPVLLAALQSTNTLAAFETYLKARRIGSLEALQGNEEQFERELARWFIQRPNESRPVANALRLLPIASRSRDQETPAERTRIDAENAKHLFLRVADYFERLEHRSLTSGHYVGLGTAERK